MFSAIYAVSFSLSVISLILWLFFRENDTANRIMRSIFLISFVLFVGAIVLSPAFLPQKLFVLARELLILAIIGFLFKALLNNRIAFAGVFILFLIGLNWYYPVLQKSLTPILPIPLAEDGELLIELSEGADLNALDEVIAEFKLQTRVAFSPKDPHETELDDYYIIDLPPEYSEDTDKIKRKLRKTGVIDWLEENEIIQVDPAPGIEKKGSIGEIKLNDPLIHTQWGLKQMGMNSFIETLNDSKVNPEMPARIFILDTGIDASHEDLKDNYRSLKRPYDRDIRGHGTHCAGIAGAVTNNSIGIASFNLSDYTLITSVKVLSDNGFGTQQSIINGIIEAADNDADVISLSLGGRSNSKKQRAYAKAVEYANKKGAIVVVAAGNSSADARNYAPANTPGVICVAAVDTTLNLASFSNSVTGIDMAVSAPGVSIMSTTPDNNYDAWNGTSMATPYVAGLIGVLKSLKPDLNTQNAFELLELTGQESNQTKKTGRLIRADKALQDLLKK